MNSVNLRGKCKTHANQIEDQLNPFLKKFSIIKNATKNKKKQKKNFRTS